MNSKHSLNGHHFPDIEKNFGSKHPSSLFGQSKSREEFLPASNEAKGVCVRVRARAHGWDMTGTHNAHIWSEFTSVLLAELNSFYRLEQIPSLTQGEGGLLLRKQSIEENSFFWNALTCAPLSFAQTEKQRKTWMFGLNFGSGAEKGLFLNDTSCQRHSLTGKTLALHADKIGLLNVAPIGCKLLSIQLCTCIYYSTTTQ